MADLIAVGTQVSAKVKFGWVGDFEGFPPSWAAFVVGEPLYDLKTPFLNHKHLACDYFM